jgi:hypothetical protein
LGSSHADSNDLSVTAIFGYPHEIPGIVQLEARNAISLSDLTNVKVMAVGR